MSRRDIFPIEAYGLYQDRDVPIMYLFFLIERNWQKRYNQVSGNRLFRYSKLSELRRVNSINEFNKINQEMNNT